MTYNVFGGTLNPPICSSAVRGESLYVENPVVYCGSGHCCVKNTVCFACMKFLVVNCVIEYGFFRRLKRYGCINRTITLSELLTKSDYMLFCKMSLPGHSLHHLLPPCRTSVNLGARGHRFELPDFNTLLHIES